MAVQAVERAGRVRFRLPKGPGYRGTVPADTVRTEPLVAARIFDC